MSRHRRQQRKRMRRHRDLDRFCKAVADAVLPKLIDMWNRPSLFSRTEWQSNRLS